MDVDDFTPAGAGSLRDPYGPATRALVATFSTSAVTHPDEWWHPLEGELDSRAPSLTSAADGQCETRQRGDARPGRPGSRTGEGYSHEETARTIRAALRLGSV